MTIQITLNANEFNHTGSHNGYNYTSLRVESFSNSRIYFVAINNGMRMVTVAKQMKCEDGKVFVSFGKNDKLIIGSYTDDSIVTNEVIEEVIAIESSNEIIENELHPSESFDKDQSITTNSPKEAWEQLTQGNQVLMNDNELNSLQEYIDTLSDDEQDLYYKHFASKFDKSLAYGLLTRCYVCKLNNYTPEAEQTEDTSEVITLTSNKSLHGYGTSVHIYDNRNINNTMTYFNHSGNESFTIRLHHEYYDKYWEVESFIYSIMKDHGKQSDFWTILGNKLNEQYGLYNIITPDKHEPKQTKQSKEDTTINESIPQLNMVASYAKVVYKGDTVNVTFSNDHESNTITFKRRKSWSHRKYVDKIINESDIKLTYDFRYGWEIQTA